MVERRIQDFPTVDEAYDNDLLLIAPASESANSRETYNVTVKTLELAIQGDAHQAVADAEAALAKTKQLADSAKSDAEKAENSRTGAEKLANTAKDLADQAKSDADRAKNEADRAAAAVSTDKTLTLDGVPADAAVVGRYIFDRTKDTPELVFYSKAETDAKIKELLAAQREEDYKRVRYWVSNDPTSPASFIGGTWERIEGEFIMGASDTYPAGSTGGAKTVTLTKENLPNYALSKACLSAVTDCYGAKIEQLKWGTTGAWHGDMMLGGSSQAFSILPPYLALYMWRRVA